MSQITVEISVGETSALYISSKCAWISRTVMPRAYSERILSSNPVHRVWCLGTICGSKLPSRSRGISMGSSPNSPLSVFLLLPFRVLPLGLATGLFLSCPRCSAISASRARLTSRLVNCWRSPFFSNEVFRLFVIRQKAVYQFVAYGHFSSFEDEGSFLPLNRFQKSRTRPSSWLLDFY